MFLKKMKIYDLDKSVFQIIMSVGNKSWAHPMPNCFVLLWLLYVHNDVGGCLPVCVYHMKLLTHCYCYYFRRREL